MIKNKLMYQKHIDIANIAFQTVPFYRKFYKEFIIKYKKITIENFHLLPLVVKTDIQNSKDDFYGDCYEKSIKLLRTSGSTGMPLCISWPSKLFTESNFHLWLLRYKWYNIQPKDKFCTFHSVSVGYEGSIYQEVLIQENGRVMSLGRRLFDDRTIEQYLKYIEEFRPVWIQGAISVIQRLYAYMKVNNKKFTSIKYIELNGEYVDPSIQNELQNYYNINVANLYGAVEFNGIALSCPYGKLHVIQDNVYVENIDKDNRIPKLVITGLVNKYMPLIRYDIGDSGKTTISECKCGCKTELSLMKGRVHELKQLMNQDVLDPTIFQNIVFDINRDKNIIKNFQVKFDENITLLLYTDAEWIKVLNKQVVFYCNKINSILNCPIRVDIKVLLIDDYNCNNKLTYIV